MSNGERDIGGECNGARARSARRSALINSRAGGDVNVGCVSSQLALLAVAASGRSVVSSGERGGGDARTASACIIASAKLVTGVVREARSSLLISRAAPLWRSAAASDPRSPRTPNDSCVTTPPVDSEKERGRPLLLHPPPTAAAFFAPPSFFVSAPAPLHCAAARAIERRDGRAKRFSSSVQRWSAAASATSSAWTWAYNSSLCTAASFGETDDSETATLARDAARDAAARTAARSSASSASRSCSASACASSTSACALP